MKNYLWIVIIGLVAFAAGCSGPPVAVEYSATCTKENSGKYVEVVGFFNNTGSAMCSKRGNEYMKCPINFVSAPGAGKPMRAELYKTTGNNAVDNPGEKGLKITDDKGQNVENADKVKLTGKVFFFGDSTPADADYLPCSVTVDKIEKVQ